MQSSHFLFENKTVYKPLVVVGPICSGKTTLINYLRYTYDQFKLAVPYTNRKLFMLDEAVEVDYNKATKEAFSEKDVRWFFKE